MIFIAAPRAAFSAHSRHKSNASFIRVSYLWLPSRSRIINGNSSAVEPTSVTCLRLEGTTILSGHVIPDFNNLRIFVKAHHFRERLRRSHDLHGSAAGNPKDWAQ